MQLRARLVVSQKCHLNLFLQLAVLGNFAEFSRYNLQFLAYLQDIGVLEENKVVINVLEARIEVNRYNKKHDFAQSLISEHLLLIGGVLDLWSVSKISELFEESVTTTFFRLPNFVGRGTMVELLYILLKTKFV